MKAVESDPALLSLPPAERRLALSAARRLMDYTEHEDLYYHTDGTPPSLLGVVRVYDDGTEVYVDRDGNLL